MKRKALTRANFNPSETENTVVLVGLTLTFAKFTVKQQRLADNNNKNNKF